MERARPALLAAVVLTLACREPQRRPPPPLPTIPPVLPSRPTADEERAPPEAAQPAARSKQREPSGKAGRSPRRTAKDVPVAPAKTAASPVAQPRAPEPPLASPVAGAKPPSSKQAVTVPRTAHVRAEFPAGLQRDLDADPRMQAWLNRAFQVIDGCHARDRSAKGVVEARLTMHESARPDANIGSVSPSLGGVVACATGPLLSTKMPLFTGAEGTRYTVRLHFE